MKVVINKCFGGFGLSPLAIKRLAELKGKPCYFFNRVLGLEIDSAPVEIQEVKGLLWSAYTVPNPESVAGSQKDFHSMTLEQRKESNDKWVSISLGDISDDRSDPDLVKVVEELGVKANGQCAELKVVEIPDGIEWEVEEYDGMERIAQKHETWG